MYIHKKTGVKITDHQYLYDLDSYEQMDYIRSVESESKTSSNRDIVDTIVDVGLGIAISSLFDNDSSSSSSSDFGSSNDLSGFDGGFGGGDFSGGGSGGDW